MGVEDDSDMTREEGIQTVYGGPSHVVILGAGARSYLINVARE
jgi:hypothetical protein